MSARSSVEAEPQPPRVFEWTHWFAQRPLACGHSAGRARVPAVEELRAEEAMGPESLRPEAAQDLGVLPEPTATYVQSTSDWYGALD
jgi:hypothetical protein